MKASALTITTPSGPRLDLVAAATSAKVRTRILGASTLTVALPEIHLAAELTEARTATAAGRDWQLVAIRRTGAVVRLVYEDAIATALRAQRGRIMYQVALPASDIIGRYCAEAGVPVDVEAAIGQVHVEGAGRSLLEETDSWREISALADRLGARAFSDGRRLIIASDATLLARAPSARVTSSRGAVRGRITFTLDVAQPQDRASFEVDDTWTADAGSVVELYGSGPADGPWLVHEWEREIPHIAPGRVQLTRPKTIGV
ncbi:hypothetical protein [Microbacterium sp. KNMS]